MVLRITGLLVILALAAPARAQDQYGWAHKLINPGGKPIAEHDFGPVAKGSLLQHRIPISNIYSVPLNVQLGVSCDCVTVTCNKPVLQPKESATLDIQMDSRRFNGPKEVTVFFTVVNQQFFSTALFKLKANCRTDVAMNPGVVNFNIVPRGEQRQSQVTVEYAGMLDWQITQAPSNELFDVTVNQKYRQPGRVGYIVQMSLKNDAPAGSYKQELLLSTNDPNAPNLPIPFELTVQPALAVLPEIARFGGARVGATSEQKLFVRSGGKPFKIVGVDGLSDGLSIAEPLPTDLKPVHILTLKFAPTAAGPVNKKLKFLTDSGDSLSATCTVDCTVAAP
jgi:Protein of unknown function (DUF1573)